MKGSLSERRPGNWELIVQLLRDTETGLRKQLSRTHHGTKREAQRALAALVAQVSAGKVTSTAKTLGELLDQWLEHVDPQLSPTTVREYRRLVATTIGPDLGSLRLGRVTTKRVDDYYAQLTAERGLSPATIRHIHAVLRGAFGQSPVIVTPPTSDTTVPLPSSSNARLEKTLTVLSEAGATAIVLVRPRRSTRHGSHPTQRTR